MRHKKILLTTNKTALRILYKTYWSNTGWKKEPFVSPEEFAYAKTIGYMFEPIRLSHDEIIDWLIKSFRLAQLKNISNAFLASLSTHRLELRSALGSFAIAKNLRDHIYQGENYCCNICGAFKDSQQPMDLSVLNFERYRWGGIRHERPEYIAFDLERFSELGDLEPTAQDYEIMKQIIEVARTCEISARPRDLEKRLAKILKSNKAEREVLIQILSYCGILQPIERSGYFYDFPKYFERVVPNVNKIDWTYPICWWHGKDGINQEALSYYFPQLI